MEVGRFGDLKFGMAALCASRWSAIGCIDSRAKNLSMKERLKANYASRWSAIGRMVERPKENGLTRAGLLMEVARNPGAKIAFKGWRLIERCTEACRNDRRPSRITYAVRQSLSVLSRRLDSLPPDRRSPMRACRRGSS